jgi:hypothetical protein
MSPFMAYLIEEKKGGVWVVATDRRYWLMGAR